MQKKKISSFNARSQVRRAGTVSTPHHHHHHQLASRVGESCSEATIQYPPAAISSCAYYAHFGSGATYNIAEDGDYRRGFRSRGIGCKTIHEVTTARISPLSTAVFWPMASPGKPAEWPAGWPAVSRWGSLSGSPRPQACIVPGSSSPCKTLHRNTDSGCVRS